MLLEALLQLCATRKIRKILREKKSYPILRELHKWEPEEDVRDACEQVVEVLIQEEQELADNLRDVDVPESVATALQDVRVCLGRGRGPGGSFRAVGLMYWRSRAPRPRRCYISLAFPRCSPPHLFVLPSPPPAPLPSPPLPPPP